MRVQRPGANAASPLTFFRKKTRVAPGGRVFIASGYGKGGAVLEVTENGGAFEVAEVLRIPRMKNKFSSSVLHDGHLYGFDEKTFKCVDVTTGEELWRQRGLGHGSLIYAEGHLIVLGDGGRLVLVAADPAAYRELSGVQIFKGKTWTVPSLSAGRLYLRDEKEIIALSIER